MATITIKPLPVVPQRTDDADVFVARADAFVGALPQFASDLTAVQSDLTSKWNDTVNNAVQTGKDVVTTTANANAAASGGAAAKWVSGNTYAQGVCVWSPLNQKTYRKVTTSSVTTVDPSTDYINWASPVLVPIGQAGDVLRSRRPLSAPDFLKADGSTYLKAAYPQLASALGSVPNDLSTWTAKPAGTSYDTMRAIAVLNGNIVTAGTNGTVMSSPDGVTWTYRSINATTQINGLAYGAGVYVLVGNSGFIYTSPDMVTWTARQVSTYNLNSITFAAGRFVAVGASGVIVVSADGVTWTTSVSALLAQDLNCIAYAFNVFAVGGSGSFQSSPDGVTWTARTATSAVIKCMAFGNGILGAVATSGTSQNGYTSSDGLTWALRTGNVYPASSPTVNALVWTGTVWYAFGNAGASTNSPDFVTWSASGGSGYSGVTPNGAVIFNSYIYIAGNPQSQDRGPVMVGANPLSGLTMVQCNAYGPRGGFGIIRYLNNQYVGISSIGAGCIATSPDGNQWTIRLGGTAAAAINATYFTDITYGNGKYVVIASNGTAYYSTDLVNFSLTNLSFYNGTTLTPYVSFGNGMFVAAVVLTIGNSTTLYSSSDGVTFSTNYSYQNNPLPGVSFDGRSKKPTYGNGQWLVPTATNVIHVGAANATGWTPRLVSTMVPAFAGACAKFGNGVFVLHGSVASNNMMLVSSDLAEWTYVPTVFTVRDIDYGQGIFMAASAEGVAILYSQDGYNWKYRAPTSFSYSSTSQVIVAIGATNAIVGSDQSLNLNKTYTCGMYSYDTSTSFYVPPIRPVDGNTSYYKT